MLAPSSHLLLIMFSGFCILFAMTAVLVGVALKKFNDKLE